MSDPALAAILFGLAAVGFVLGYVLGTRDEQEARTQWERRASRKARQDHPTGGLHVLDGGDPGEAS